MSTGNRVLVAAAFSVALLLSLGTGAFFGSLYAPDFGGAPTHLVNQNSVATEKGQSQLSRDRAGLPEFVERMVSGPDPKDGTERDKRDLAAQESMSVWGFWGFAVTTIGTIFLAVQMILTRGAVQETAKATKAMERQNEIAEAAQRPWLVFDIKGPIPVTRHSSGAFSADFDIVIKNKGPMPATHVNAYLGFTRSHLEFDPQEFINQAQLHVSVVGYSLAPSDEMPWKGGDFLHGLTFRDGHGLPDGSLWIGVAYRGIDGIRDYCTFDVFNFTGNGIWKHDREYTVVPGRHCIKRVMT